MEKMYERIRTLRGDRKGVLDVRYWVFTIVLVIVLVLVVAALMPQLNSALENYSAEDPNFGPILEDIVPILVGVAILLGILAVLLPVAMRRFR